MGGQWEAQSGKGIGMQYARLRHSLPGKKALILSLGCCTGELPYAEQHPWEPDLVGLGGAQPSTFWKSSLGDFNVQPSLRAFDLLGQRDKDRRTEEATVSDRLCAPFSQSFPPLLTVSSNNIIQVFFKWRCRKTHLKINNTEKEVRCDETLRRRPSHWREMPRC